MLHIYDKWRNHQDISKDLLTKDWKPKPSQWGLDPALKPTKPVDLDAAIFLAENFISVIPQAGKYEYEPDLLVKLADDIEKSYRVDGDRMCLTGLSYGGYYSLETAMAYPDRFASIVPICGGNAKKELKNMKNVPTWIFHGALDDVMPVSYAQKIHDTLKSYGGNVRITVFPDAYHDAFTQAYNKLDLYEWIFAQNRKNNY